VRLAPGERQDGSDTLAETCTYAPAGGHALVLDPPVAVEGPQQGGPLRSWAASLRVHSCEVFQTVAVVTARQRDLSDDVRQTTWCPFEEPIDVRVTVGGGATFDLRVTPGVSFTVPVTGDGEVAVTVTRLDTGASSVGSVHLPALAGPALGAPHEGSAGAEVRRRA
jgi:hypothetical protein